MKLKTIWLWGDIWKCVVVCLLASAGAGFLAAWLDAGSIVAAALGLMIGVSAGHICLSLWECWRFELVDE